MTTIIPNDGRLQGFLDQFASADVGGTLGGGVSRPAASDFDMVARNRFRGTAEQLGLAVRVDDAGNMYARREGSESSALPVVLGSHLDTVVPGGRFDGILGVAAALETVACLNDIGAHTSRPIVVVNWTGEEGARFAPAMLGSGVVTGAYKVDYALSRTDADGLSLGSELERIGYAGNAANRLRDFFAALEMHIEQGPLLEEAGLDLGLVTMIGPVRWCCVSVSGPGGHAGGPGPAGRRDAMVGAARMVVAARDETLKNRDFKITVGRLAVEPASNNVIPHKVVFTLDVRSDTDIELDAHLAKLRDRFASIAKEEGLEVDLTVDWAMRSTPFSARVRSVLAAAAKATGASYREMRGTIGHDSLHLAAMGPTAMLFTTTRGGRSHCEDEFSPWKSILAATRVFAETALHLANVADIENGETSS